RDVLIGFGSRVDADLERGDDLHADLALVDPRRLRVEVVDERAVRALLHDRVAVLVARTLDDLDADDFAGFLVDLDRFDRHGEGPELARLGIPVRVEVGVAGRDAPRDEAADDARDAELLPLRAEH